VGWNHIFVRTASILDGCKPLRGHKMCQMWRGGKPPSHRGHSLLLCVELLLLTLLLLLPIADSEAVLCVLRHFIVHALCSSHQTVPGAR
jgi:hypothetical protein